MGGRSKAQTVGYKYSLGMHLVLCHGTVDNINRIDVDEKVAWQGVVPNGSIYINQPEMFGGESREGGVVGTVDFMDGAPTQGVNSYLQSKLGAAIPAFRGVASVVLRKVYIGLNPYLKNWSFRIQRIFKKSDGSPQWYSRVAGIAVVNVPETTAFSVLGTMPWTGWAGWDGANFYNPDSKIQWIGGRYPTSPPRVARILADGTMDTIPITGMAGHESEAGIYSPTWGMTLFFSKNGGSSFRVAESTNNGQTWKVYSQATTNPGSWQNSYGAMWDPHKNRVLVCGGEGTNYFIASGVRELVDIGGGQYDTRLRFTHLPISGLASYLRSSGFAVTPDHSIMLTKNLVGSSSSKYCRSIDGGDTWTVHPNPGESPSSFGEAEWNPFMNAFIASGSSGGNFLFFVSPDGLNWTQSIIGPTWSGFGGTIPKCVVDPISGTIIFGSSVYAYSRNNGQSWQQGTLAYVTTFPSGGVTTVGDQYFWFPPLSRVLATGVDEIAGTLEVLQASKIEGIATGDMNPAHIIRECLTDPVWGMGYPEAEVDDVSFTAAADQLYAETMGISLIWDRQIPIEDFIKEVLKHIDAALYVDRLTGKFTLKLIRADYIESTLITLGEDEIDRVEDYSRPTLIDLVSSVTASYWDQSTGKTATITVDDPSLIQMQGAVVNTTVQYPGFTLHSLASRAAQRDLRTLSTPLLSCTIYANRAAASLNIGDVFKFEWPDYHSGYIVMRVTGLALGDGRSNKIKITCVEDVFALPETTIVQPQLPEWEDPSSPPTHIQHQIAFELPYLELVQQAGQLTVDNLLSSMPGAGYVGAAAARPHAATINARLFTDSGAGYEDVASLDFCPFAVVASDVDRVQTTLPISSSQDLDQVTLGSWAQVGNEIVVVEAIGLTSIDVKRGALDTVPAEHAAASVILFWDAYTQGDSTEYVASDVVDVKLAPVSGSGQLGVDSVAPITVELAGRAYRPYPPAQVMVNGSYYPVEPLTSVDLSWVHRNRVQQTGSVVLGFMDGGLTPEAGTSYSVAVYNTSGVLLFSEAGIVGTTYSVPGSVLSLGLGELDIELKTVRDSVESLYSHRIRVRVAAQFIMGDTATPPNGIVFVM